MKKKGFTLVELLAVIAILAILVIIALPNVMGMFNTAKQNSFTTEIKEIYKQAQQQWISDSMMSTDTIKYWRVNGATGASIGNGIDLTGRTQLNYYIVIDKSGAITSYFATDGSYQYAYFASSTTDGLQVEDIGDTTKKSGTLSYDSSNATSPWTYAATGGKINRNEIKQVSSLGSGETLTVSTTGASLN